jgi:hypothetical protein
MTFLWGGGGEEQLYETEDAALGCDSSRELKKQDDLHLGCDKQ